MKRDVPPIDPAEHIRHFRGNYVNMRRLLKDTEGAPADANMRTPDEQSIEELDLPPALREAMAAYRRENPGTGQLTPVKYMKTVNGQPEIVIEDDAPLPEEEDLVTFSYSLSAASIRAVTVVTHQLVATIGAIPKAGPKPGAKPEGGPGQKRGRE